MKCVKCSGNLIETLINGVPVDLCDQCDGLWFDKGELDWLIQIYKLAHDDHFNKKHFVLDKKPGNCPRCGTVETPARMVQVHREFNIDECHHCEGHWLEAGELQALREEYRYQQLLKAVRGELD
jgi:Zn-finger nucleic acid-binding protein